jgi:Arc/MetJ-type ribon-helix-helix transcriptional regulator
MGEKWFEFVKRIKKEGNYASLSEAMKAASKRKSEWKKDGAAHAASAASPMAKSSGKKTKKARKSRKSKKSRKSRKSKKR